MDRKNVIFDKKIVLITGGAGFIGSHLCDELIKTAKVICLDNFSSGSEKNVDHLLSEENFEFIRHDLSKPIDFDNLPELQKFKIKFQGIQEIYHLACPMSVKNFTKNTLATLDANSLVMKNVLDLAKKYQAKLLHFSSSVIYGTSIDKKHKVSENEIGQIDFLSERGFYDEGKRFAETFAYNYGKINNLPIKIIRPFRIYGPRMPLGDGQMIPDFINNALDNIDLTIYGNKDFASSLCYIDDLVDATLKLMSSDLQGPLNIGSDISVNLTVLAKQIISELGSKSKISYAKKILFMTPLSIPNINEAKSSLGWMPIISLGKGIKETIYHLRASKGLKSLKQLATND